MGTYQENKALKSAEALNKMLITKTKVLREKKEVIDKYVELFKNPSTPENILFEMIAKGSDDLNLLEDSKGEKSL